jgi:hypothetical protein
MGKGRHGAQKHGSGSGIAGPDRHNPAPRRIVASEANSLVFVQLGKKAVYITVEFAA